jgi:WD40 repeat protein
VCLLLALRTGGASSPDPHDNTIRIWDAETGAAVGQPLVGHNGPVWSVACSPDGRRIISGSDDKTIRIWDAETGAAVGEPLVGHNGWCGLLLALRTGGASSPDPHDNTIRIWDAETGAAVERPLEGIPRVHSLLLTLPTRSTLPLGLVTAPSRCRTHLHRFPSNILSKSVLICVHRQIQKVGSRTHRVPYYIGYLQTVVSACIHLLFSQYLRHPIFGQFLLISKTLLLEPPGPRFSTLHSLSLSVLWNPCL